MERSEVILSVYIISFLIGLPANLLALYAFSDKIQSKPLPTDILLLNLTVSGLLFRMALPLKMHEATSGMKWNLPDFICSIASFSTIYTGSLLLMASAHRQLQKPVYAIVIGAVIWRITLPSTTHLWRTRTSLCAMRTSQKSSWKRFSLCSSLYLLLICVYCYLRCILGLGDSSCVSHLCAAIQRLSFTGLPLGWQPKMEVLQLAAWHFQHLYWSHHLLLFLRHFPLHQRKDHFRKCGLDVQRQAASSS